MNGRTVTLAGMALIAVVVLGAFGALRWASADQPLGDANCDGAVNSIDATLVLQLNAGLLQSVACQGKADTNADDRVDSLDAALILQFTAGLLDGLGPVETPSPLPTSTPVGTPKPLPTSTPATTAGVYTGTHAAGGTVTFEVNDYGSRILRFSTATEKVFGCRKNFTVVSSYIWIRGSYFSYDSYGKLSFTGVLDGSGSASGTLSYESCRLVNVPWTATRTVAQPTSTPTVAPPTSTPAFEPPNNDDFVNAWQITSFPFRGEQNTVLATTEPGEEVRPSWCMIGATVWFTFTPTISGIMSANTEGSSSSYDTVLVLYQGSELSALTLLGCDDDGGTGLLSAMSFSVTAGTTYYIQAGGFGTPGDVGNLVLSVSLEGSGGAVNVLH